MQCCILKFFPNISVTYGFTNRTPDKKLNRAAFRWLEAQVASTSPGPAPARPLTAAQSSSTFK